MNIFENLIEELKEENLLEQTVIDVNRNGEKPNDVDEAPDFSSEDILLPADEADEPENAEDAAHEERDAILEAVPDAPEMFEEKIEVEAPEKEMLEEEIEVQDAEAETLEEDVEVEAPESKMFDEMIEDETPEAESVSLSVPEESESSAQAQQSELKAAPKGVEFYRQRAIKEVSGLQMVEHIISGVEREQMKVVPKPYDDLEAKKILHSFLQVSGDLNSPEHAQAEFKLMQETESWYSALSHRDKNISVSHLRRYCETTRPHLSSQALISAARFYRNSPYSEAVRSKFDLVITRLFTKDADESRRKLAFDRDDMIKHLTMLYGEWQSIPLYSANEDDSEILLMTLKFEDFMNEADNADTFDELVKNDFFNRLRAFKETTHENFFAPLLTATAIECNVRIGNQYVELLQIEKEKADIEGLEEKYGYLHDQSISEAASKTLQLVELLNKHNEDDEDAFGDDREREALADDASDDAKTVKSKPKKRKSKLFAVNKWLLLATILVVIGNAALYIWLNYGTEAATATKDVKVVNLENSVLKDFVREGRIANDTFFGVTQPSWLGLGVEKKEEILKKVLSTGGDKGYNKVHLLDSRGKTVGYADAEKVEVF